MALHETIVFNEDIIGLVINNSTARSLDTANATLFPEDSSTSITTSTSSDTPFSYAFLSLGWLVVLLYCVCRRNVVDQRHWRGREIRQQALEERLRQRAQQERDNQSPLERRKLVQKAIITKVRNSGFEWSGLMIVKYMCIAYLRCK
jgi:hypothetical protein